MNSHNIITHKLNLLNESERREVQDFIEFLLTREKRRDRTGDIAEEGMGDYLSDLQAYEDKLAAGEIRW